jgi:hypothetical protein
MEAQAPKPRRGRPPKTGGEAKRAPFFTRMRPSIKARLEEAARQNQRSVSEEAEARLEQSFETRPLLGALQMGYGQLGAVLVLIGELAIAAERDATPGEEVLAMMRDIASGATPVDEPTMRQLVDKLHRGLEERKAGLLFSDATAWWTWAGALGVLLRELAPAPPGEISDMQAVNAHGLVYRQVETLLDPGTAELTPRAAALGPLVRELLGPVMTGRALGAHRKKRAEIEGKRRAANAGKPGEAA